MLRARVRPRCNTATITYYKSVMSAKLAASPSLDIGNEIFAIQDQLNSSV